ncbi:hypothetical protein M8C21_031864, partial [Ambrosia artemisiifolia]
RETFLSLAKSYRQRKVSYVSTTIWGNNRRLDNGVVVEELSHGRGRERERRRRESGVFSDESVVPIHGLKHGEPYGGDRLSDRESVRFCEDERRLRRFFEEYQRHQINLCLRRPLILWIRELEYANIVVHFSDLKKDVKGATTPTPLTPVPTNPFINEKKRDATTRRQLFETEGNKNPAKGTATDNRHAATKTG